MITRERTGEVGAHRAPAVAGSFYPGEPRRLRDLVGAQLAAAAALSARTPSAERPAASGLPLGILVPHAGLAYSGVVAATAWRLLEPAAGRSLTVVILGTNHRAGWLDGVAAWDRGSWHTPVGDVAVDDEIATAIVSLGPPFVVDREAHLEEHSIEVQLPLLHGVASAARIVPLACSPGVGRAAVDAGARLGALLADQRTGARRIVLAISTDMAHYPSAADAEAITAELLPFIVGLDPVALATRERDLRHASSLGHGPRGLACGMCGIEPTVVGLEAIGAMGAGRGAALAATTSADVGGPPDRTVGYLAVRFD